MFYLLLLTSFKAHALLGLQIKNPYINHYKNISPSITNIYTNRSRGSGFIISKDGFVITNAHVVANTTRLYVQIFNNKYRYAARLIATDTDADIALLKIEKTGLKPVKLGDSKGLKVGQYVFSISSPDGYSYSLMKGIVSYKKRKSPLNVFPLLQLDLTLDVGSSGGAIFNLDGEVIGVINALSAKSTGIGFAIPINDVKRVLKDFKAYNKRYIYAQQIVTKKQIARNTNFIKRALLSVKLFFQKLNSFIVAFKQTRLELKRL